MNRAILVSMSAVFVLALGLTGCKPSEKQMAEMMKPPARPEAIDQLQMFVGSWDAEAQLKMAGEEETKTTTGSNTVRWAANKWVIVEHYEHDMGEGNKAHGVGIWAYDMKAKKFRLFSADDYGNIGTGEATYDEATKTWKFKSTTNDTRNGGASCGRGTATVEDKNTMAWEWSEFGGPFNLMKFMEISGKRHKKN